MDGIEDKDEKGAKDPPDLYARLSADPPLFRSGDPLVIPPHLSVLQAEDLLDVLDLDVGTDLRRVGLTDVEQLAPADAHHTARG